MHYIYKTQVYNMWQCDKSEKKTALKKIDVYKSIVVTRGKTYLSGTLKTHLIDNFPVILE